MREKNNMNFVWRDYNSETMGCVEIWFDETAVNLIVFDDIEDKSSNNKAYHLR